MSEKIKVQLGLIIFLAIIAVSLISAPHSGPDFPPLFALKRIQEKTFLKFQSSPEGKLIYMSSILNSRLEELQNLVNNKNYNYVLPSSLRYFSLAGQMTDLIIANNLTGQVSAVKEQFLKHRKIIDTIYVIYPKNIPDNEEWKYIQDDYNYLAIYIDKLSAI